MRRAYLDHAATTPLLPEARAEMEPWLDGQPTNASSIHGSGRRAKDALDMSRETFSTALGCLFGEVIFTSSGTEACNLALVGAALAHTGPRRRLLVGAAEHHAVLNTRSVLARLGFRVEAVRVNHVATVDLEDLEAKLSDDVLLVSVMHANNEVGSVNDVRAVSRLAQRVGALVHTDAVQTFPFCPGVDELGVDLLSLAGHKFGGPTGFGALYIRGGTPVGPVTWGGGQERETRAGTENVAACVGSAAACRWCRDNGAAVHRAKSDSRDAFLAALEGLAVVTPAGPGRLPGHAHVRFPGVDNESLLIRLDRMGVEASAGAACSSGSIEPSHVLVASGWSEGEAREAVRFTFGHGSTREEAEWAAVVVRQAVDAVRTA
ncbi:MAG: cysteine desulfurase [Fimbriimonadaceae bacterium]|nr:cysteine desulfurase [Fimbriimonadaceae bacterium]